MNAARKVIEFLVMLALLAMPSSVFYAREETSLQDFVDQLHEGQLEMEEAEAFISDLTEAQKEEVLVLMAEKQGLSGESARRTFARRNNSNSSAWLLSSSSAHIPRTHSSNGTVGAHNFNDDPGCDGDGSDNDHLFKFMVYPSNIRGMRWYTSDSWIGIAFDIAYNSMLLAVPVGSQTGICLGTWGTLLAGGQWHVFYNLKLKPAW